MCMQGRYCDELALDNAHDKLCDPGYLCEYGNQQADPTGGITDQTDIDGNVYRFGG